MKERACPPYREAACRIETQEPYPRPAAEIDIGPDIQLRKRRETRQIGQSAPHDSLHAEREVSVLGIGGHTLTLASSESESVDIVHAAIDAGLTFMDNAWHYHDGRVLFHRPGYRDGTGVMA